MAKRRKRRSPKRKQENEYPGWVWMIFGLAIGLSVAFAVYVKDRQPVIETIAANTPPASLKESLGGDTVAESPTEIETEAQDERFDFYDLLPAFELVIDEDEPVVSPDVGQQAIEEPGLYMLQAGSFSTHNDADRRRAELALHGLESRVQRARVNRRDFYRVYIGPINDLEELNITLSRLRAANIDVMRIRLGD